jgi:hypothetical protein
VFRYPRLTFPKGCPVGSLRALSRQSPRTARTTALPPNDALSREHRKFPFEMRFDPGMLLDKPGHKVPQGQSASRVRGGAPAAPSPPHGARGSALLRHRHNADAPSGPPQGQTRITTR